jgi:predicted AAA+ superfamily ATPase
MPILQRIAEALERLAPVPAGKTDFASADAFVWRAERSALEAVLRVNAIDIGLLKGIDQARDTLLENTRRFADGLPANNALLWGARGMGKSSLVKAAHAEVNAGRTETIVLIEIHREDIATLPLLLARLRVAERHCILFCDDLSFDGGDASYKSLKALLEGGIEGRPENVIFYATSNRRHMISRDIMENESATAIIARETVDEKVSLSDRFGLWIGFHACDQATYLAIVDGYAQAYGLAATHADAIEWSLTRGARSGRVAWQFIQDLAGRLGQSMTQAD